MLHTLIVTSKELEAIIISLRKERQVKSGLVLYLTNVQKGE